MGDPPNLYLKIGSLVCAQLMEGESPEFLDQSLVIGRNYTDLSLTSLAIAYMNRSVAKPAAFGFLGKLNNLDGNILKAFYYYLLASLSNGAGDFSKEMVGLSRSVLNINQTSPEIITCLLVSSSLLVSTNKKYAKIWNESLNRFKKLKEFGEDPKLIIETICLLLIHVYKKSGVFNQELNELFMSACKIAQKADKERLDPALQLYTSTFPCKIMGSTKIFRDSELNFLIDETKAKTIVWTIVDADVLVHNFESVKQLIFYGQIRLLISLAVVRRLDRKKFKGYRVKEVITYLDDMLSHGSDAIRFQTLFESKHIMFPGDFGLVLMGTIDHYHRLFFEAMAYFSTRLGNCKYEIWSRNIEIIKRAMALGIPLARTIRWAAGV